MKWLEKDSVKLIGIYLICFSITILISFSTLFGNEVKRFILILITNGIVFILLNILFKVRFKASMKFIIFMVVLMGILAYNENYFYSATTPDLGEQFLSIIALIGIPFGAICDIMFQLNIFEYTFIAIILYFGIISLTLKIGNKIHKKFHKKS
ncbi:MAG: hypothetical protein ACRCWM_11885 [Sarcina sp.]